MYESKAVLSLLSGQSVTQDRCHLFWPWRMKKNQMKKNQMKKGERQDRESKYKGGNSGQLGMSIAWENVGGVCVQFGQKVHAGHKQELLHVTLIHF